VAEIPLSLTHRSASSSTYVGEWLSLVEHLVRDQGVGGSNPLSPTIYPGKNIFLPASNTQAGASQIKFLITSHPKRKENTGRLPAGGHSRRCAARTQSSRSFTPRKLQLTTQQAFAILSKRLASPPQISRIGLSGPPGLMVNEMIESESLVHSGNLPAEQSGELLHLPRQQARWEWMSFFVRRLQPGEAYQVQTEGEEAAFVLLGGTCLADWGAGEKRIGKRKNVFDGLPYALYLPTGSKATFTAETVCEIAECRVPSQARLEPKLVTPQDVASNLRGGGNVSRQIVDVMPSGFPAERLIVIEVYTPGGNWSSYPPHKHDVHNPPTEVDLDEIYYYRMNQPDAFAFQHLYSRDNPAGQTVKTRDGDAVLVRSGFHPVVAGPGYDVYYLNFLAGTSRTMAITEDSRHVWIRSTWKEPDPRLPLVKG
jgi:5-deoxy-glucuronate isomerase